MLEVVDYLSKRLSRLPFNQHHYSEYLKNKDHIFRACMGLSNEVSTMYGFNTKINELQTPLERGGVRLFRGYRIDLHLAGIDVGLPKSKLGPGQRTLIDEKDENYKKLEEETGRSWPNLCRKIKHLPKKFRHHWFIKNDPNIPYEKSELAEHVSVVRKIPGGNPLKIGQEEIDENYLFRFNMAATVTMYSYDLERILQYPDVFNYVVYDVFGKGRQENIRGKFVIPLCPVIIEDILEHAINSYGHRIYPGAAALARSAFETTLRLKFIELKGGEPFKIPKCGTCGQEQKKRPMNMVELFEWALKEGILDRDLRHFSFVPSDVGATGSHGTGYVGSKKAEININDAIGLAKLVPIDEEKLEENMRKIAEGKK